MRPRSNLVTGYHGCDRDFGRKLIANEQQLQPNDKKYHWLGTGIYFWENDPERALEWAKEKASRGEIANPYVVGAVIDLGHCLDLSLRDNIPLIKEAHRSLEALFAASGRPMPENRPAPKDPRKEDKVMRFLDHAVLNHLFENADTPFDTARGLFVEGKPIYDGAGLYEKTHVEIAVRSENAIKGIFHPINPTIAA